MGTNVWAVVGGSTFSLPMEALLGTANQLLGMNPAATMLQYKDGLFDNTTGFFITPNGYTFVGDLDTYLGPDGADSMHLVCGGTQRAKFTSVEALFAINVRLNQKIIQEDVGADIVAAATTDLGTATGNLLTITHAAGLLDITGLGGATVAAGTEIETIFSIAAGTVTLIHNATSLALLGGLDIILEDGDIVRWRKTNDASAYWRMMSFSRGSLSPFASNFPVGFVGHRASVNVPAGWLECDGSAVSRATYAALFAELGIVWGSGDGVTTFNLPDERGRVRMGRGAGGFTEAGGDSEVDIAANELIVPSNTDKWITGMPVVFTLSSGTVTGLTSGLTYYVIRMSPTTISLALNLNNAQNGVEIDFTAKAAPIWTIARTLIARTLGVGGGEDAHAMSILEMLLHDHTGLTGIDLESTSVPTGTGPSGGGIIGNAGHRHTIPNEGGNQAMNVTQPYNVFLPIIKT